MRHILATVLVASLASHTAVAQPCDTFRDAKGRSTIDFAPPPGFIDVCSRDVLLCTVLTQGYPPSVTTVAYFVTVEDWQRYQHGERKGFSQYLIAQLARTMSSDKFAEIKKYIHDQAGQIPDHTELPPPLVNKGNVPLGIIDETDDSISFGNITKLEPEGASSGSSFLQASINIALQMKGQTLSLYVFEDLADISDASRAKALSRRWLACIKSRNSQ